LDVLTGLKLQGCTVCLQGNWNEVTWEQSEASLAAGEVIGKIAASIKR
jgi:hypothetical protein